MFRISILRRAEREENAKQISLTDFTAPKRKSTKPVEVPTRKKKKKEEQEEEKKRKKEAREEMRRKKKEEQEEEKKRKKETREAARKKKKEEQEEENKRKKEERKEKREERKRKRKEEQQEKRNEAKRKKKEELDEIIEDILNDTELDRICNQAMDEVEKLNDAELDFICNYPERVCNETFSDDDSLCNETMDQFEKQQVPDDEEQQVSDEEEGQSGAGLKFELYPHTDKRARKFGIHRRVFTTCLTQPTDLSKIPRANLPQLIERALQQAINEQVLDGHENNNDWLMINMSSNRLKHAYNSHQVRVGEWRHDTQPARAILEKISKILNSNEQFEIDDSFHIEVSHIRDAGTGSGANQEGGSGRRVNPKIKAVEQVLKNKKSVVKINNQDELCCARALVTAQAFHEYGARHNTYDCIKRGLSEQERRAKTLHREARVPEGPCGIGEIQQFQIILSDYQIVVVSVDHGYQIIYKGPAQPKQLVLVKNGDHYHACNSLSGFMGKVYYCVDCEKGFNNDDLAHHRCKGKKCYACHQTDCSDFKNAHGQEARLPCDACNRFFFGEVCKAHHRLRKSSGTTVVRGG